MGELNGDDDALGIAADNAVVSSLIGTGDAEPAGGGEAASVPLAEEGFNLWEPEADEREASAPRDAASTQVGNRNSAGCCVDVMALVVLIVLVYNSKCIILIYYRGTYCSC